MLLMAGSIFNGLQSFGGGDVTAFAIASTHSEEEIMNSLMLSEYYTNISTVVTNMTLDRIESCTKYSSSELCSYVNARITNNVWEDTSYWRIIYAGKMESKDAFAEFVVRDRDYEVMYFWVEDSRKY